MSTMKNNPESYVDSVRDESTVRRQKVTETVRVLGRITRDHAFFSSDPGEPLEVPSIRWKEDTAHLELFAENRKIDKANVPEGVPIQETVDSADFVLYLREDSDDRTLMTIQTRPPNVLGHDGSPLTAPQIDGAIADLLRYEAELIGNK